MTIEPNGYKTLKEENKEQKQIINDFREQNFELRKDLGTYINKHNKLFDENEILKNELFNYYLHQQHNERLISELKEALSSYNNFVDVMFPD